MPTEYTTKTLKALTGYKHSSAVESCLQRNGIKYFLGKDGPWTTAELINAAGGLVAQESGADKSPEYPLDLI